MKIEQELTYDNCRTVVEEIVFSPKGYAKNTLEITEGSFKLLTTKLYNQGFCDRVHESDFLYPGTDVKIIYIK